MTKKEKSDFISELESTLSPERVKKARNKATKTISKTEIPVPVAPKINLKLFPDSLGCDKNV